MKIEKFFNPICQENMYMIIYENKDCVLIDTGDLTMQRILEKIEEDKLNLKAILITHGHFDHIMGIPKVVEYKKVPVYISKEDKHFLYDSKFSLSFYVNEDFKLSEDIEVITFENGDKLFDFEVISTPGHTKGSVCFYNEEKKVMFTGDTIMRRAYGRVDFPTGDAQEMVNTLRRIVEFPEDVMMYPGHGANTLIKNEKPMYKYY